MKHLIGLSRVAVFAVFFSVVGVTSTAHADTTINSQAEAHAFAAGVAAPILAGCAISGPGILVCGGIAAGAVLCYMYCDDILSWIMESSGHRKNARKSTKDKHEAGDARRQRDQRRKEERQRQGRGGPGGS